MMQASDDVRVDKTRWMQQGVTKPSVRKPSELFCVAVLPTPSEEYVPPFDCEPEQLHSAGSAVSWSSESEEDEEDTAFQSERRKRKSTDTNSRQGGGTNGGQRQRKT